MAKSARDFRVFESVFVLRRGALSKGERNALLEKRVEISSGVPRAVCWSFVGSWWRVGV